MSLNCPKCKIQDSSKILYSGYNQHIELHFECTSHNKKDSKDLKPTLYKCLKCNLVYSEFINIEFSKNYKPVIDEEYIKQIDFKKKTFEIFVKQIKKHLNKDSEVLEIGSYYGVLGSLIKPLVKNYIGTELSIHAAKYARENFDLNIINDAPDEYLKRGNKFDLIIMTDVIEHLDDPFTVLKLLEKSLNENGIIIITTFNFDSLFSKIMGKNYPWILPFHKYYFSNSTIKKTLNDANLNVVKIENDIRLISADYLIKKLNVMIGSLGFLWKFIDRISFIKKLTFRINLYDLKIYYCTKIEKDI